MKKSKPENTKSPLKESYSRRPGQSLDEQIARLQEKLVMYIVVPGLLAVSTFVVWEYYFVKNPPHPIIITVLFSIVLIYCMLKIFQIRKQGKNLVLGREGEREVAEYLDNLTRRGCYVFHDIRGPNFNIDHVVISTYGIFTIETKAYSKPSQGETKVTFDGHSVKLTGKQPDSGPIQQALHQAQWLRNKIRDTTNRKLFDITAIVVFLNWFVPEEQMKHKGIWVLNEKWLESSITQQQPILTPDEVKAVVSVFRPLTQSLRTSL